MTYFPLRQDKPGKGGDLAWRIETSQSPYPLWRPRVSSLDPESTAAARFSVRARDTTRRRRTIDTVGKAAASRSRPRRASGCRRRWVPHRVRLAESLKCPNCHFCTVLTLHGRWAQFGDRFAAIRDRIALAGPARSPRVVRPGSDTCYWAVGAHSHDALACAGHTFTDATPPLPTGSDTFSQMFA